MKFITIENFSYSKALVIDNAYDVYTLNRYIDYCRENDIKALCSQDLDLSYLKHFSDIKQLSISEEAYNVSCINDLKDLKELRLFSSSIKFINQEVLEKLTSLEIFYNQKTNINFSQFKSLKNLVINNCPFENIEIKNNLECLHLKDCNRITSLSFLSKCEINKIRLYNLKRLSNISKISEQSNLSLLEIVDCINIQNIEETLSKLINLKELKIFSERVSHPYKLTSLGFISNMKKLEKFTTNYRIQNGDLRPLEVLKDASIYHFYRNYNLKDKELPHEEVLLDENGEVNIVKLSKLPKGKEDERIVWMDTL